MIIFLASDVMLFAPFFAAYYMLRSTTPVWPPAGIELDIVLPLLGTIALVSSSFTLIVADRALARDDRSGMRAWLWATIALGVTFLVLQFVDYSRVGFAASDNAYTSIYWLLTGLHTCHVIAGVLLLMAIQVRIARAPDLESTETWAAAGSAFWHLVDVVWIAVFISIWVIQ